MDNFVIEICEQNEFIKTLKVLKKTTTNRGLKQRLENFILYKKSRKIKVINVKKKLSFEVSLNS